MAHTKTSNMLSRRLSRLALAFMLVSFAGWALLSNNALNLVAPIAHAANLVVTNTNNSGAGSLRQAILDANANGSAVVDTIAFNIPGGGVKTIAPASALPDITTPTTIDGYTQPGTSVNTLDVGDNAVLLIELSGTNAGANADGLTIKAPGTTIRGLVINRFGSGGNHSGLAVSAADAKIEGNFLGTNVSGSAALANDIGVSFGGFTVDPITNCIVGGMNAAARNIISGNTRSGVYFIGNNVSDSAVQGNYIGIDATGTVALANKEGGVLVQIASRITIGGTTAVSRNVISGNTAFGVAFTNGGGNHIVQGNYIGTQANGTSTVHGPQAGVIIVSSGGNTIGGTVSGAGNIIAYNAFRAVYVREKESTGNAILANSTFSNGLGIDLGGDGLTANDNGDGDTGSNNLQNFPVLTAATVGNGTLAVAGTLNSIPNTSFRIEYFLNPDCHEAGFGEGKIFVGAKSVQTDASGNANVDASFSTLASGQVVTATATDAANNTSEFSQCFGVSAATPGTLQFSQPTITANESAGSATISVTRTGGSSGAVAVQYATVAGGSATANVDYTTIQGTLSWANGDASSKTFTVPIIDDTIYEVGVESVNLALSGPSGGAALGNPNTATLNIDDDDPVVSLSINDVSKAEGNSGVTNFDFTVSLSAVSGKNVQVDYATVPGTAQDSSDYLAVSGKLTFTPGETSKTVTVQVVGDPTQEPDEMFGVLLSNAGKGYLLAKASATGTIINDDAVAGPAFDFSQANYSVAEQLGVVTVTVVRSGDSSAAAAVDYATSDGSATQKGDFEIAAGTLNFAPGETSKTIQVLLNQDSHIEGPEGFNLVLSNPSGAVLGQQSTTVNITDDVPETMSNPVDDAQSFVHLHYHDFLNREPDQEGLQFWTNEITSCGSDAACIAAKRTNVSAAFFLSIEFQRTGYLLYLFQKESYASLPKYAAFMRDLQEVSRGVVVNAPGWEQKLAANQQQFAEKWVNRAEFKAAYDGMSNTAFVNALYANAGVVPPQEETVKLVTALDTATQTRAAVLLEVAGNAVYKQQEQNAAFVLMQYFSYLRRDPDSAPDSDLSGYYFWLNKLNSFNGDYQQAEMVKAFLNSSEYRGRFGLQ